MDPNVKLKSAAEDITFVVSVISQFIHALRPTHFKVVFRIVRYLKRTPRKGLMFKNRGHIQVEAYTDANWTCNINDRRSTSGYCTFVGGNLVTWRSKKQNVVARRAMHKLNSNRWLMVFVKYHG